MICYQREACLSEQIGLPCSRPSAVPFACSPRQRTLAVERNSLGPNSVSIVTLSTARMETRVRIWANGSTGTTRRPASPAEDSAAQYQHQPSCRPFRFLRLGSLLRKAGRGTAWRLPQRCVVGRARSREILGAKHILWPQFVAARNSLKTRLRGRPQLPLYRYRHGQNSTNDTPQFQRSDVNFEVRY